MSVQNHIDVIRQMVGWYVLKTESQAASHNIDN
jgi:hypothetical protein